MSTPINTESLQPHTGEHSLVHQDDSSLVHPAISSLTLPFPYDSASIHPRSREFSLTPTTLKSSNSSSTLVEESETATSIEGADQEVVSRTVQAFKDVIKSNRAEVLSVETRMSKLVPTGMILAALISIGIIAGSLYLLIDVIPHAIDLANPLNELSLLLYIFGWMFEIVLIPAAIALPIGVAVGICSACDLEIEAVHNKSAELLEDMFIKALEDDDQEVLKLFSNFTIFVTNRLPDNQPPAIPFRKQYFVYDHENPNRNNQLGGLLEKCIEAENLKWVKALTLLGVRPKDLPLLRSTHPKSAQIIDKISRDSEGLSSLEIALRDGDADTVEYLSSQSNRLDLEKDLATYLEKRGWHQENHEKIRTLDQAYRRGLQVSIRSHERFFEGTDVSTALPSNIQDIVGSFLDF